MMPEKADFTQRELIQIITEYCYQGMRRTEIRKRLFLDGYNPDMRQIRRIYAQVYAIKYRVTL